MKGDKTIPIAWAMVAAIAMWVIIFSVGPAAWKAYKEQPFRSSEPTYVVIR